MLFIIMSVKFFIQILFLIFLLDKAKNVEIEVDYTNPYEVYFEEI